MDQLIYRSDAARTTMQDEVFRIIEQSARNNPARGVTGFLVYANGAFLQYVEGEQDAIDTLLADLGRDPRHTKLTILARRPLDRRRFPNWTMKRLAWGTGGTTALLETLRRSELTPDLIDLVRSFVEERPAAA